MGFKLCIEVVDIERYGRGVFCRFVKVFCKGCWRY